MKILRTRNLRPGRATITIRQSSIYVIGLIAVLGISMLVISKASTISLQIEAENGASDGIAKVVNDQTASGGKAIIFGSVNSKCQQGGAYLWSHLEDCGWAGPNNTGPKLSECSGGVLIKNSGSLSRVIDVNKDNTTISCQDISGCIRATGNNIVIKNVKITCNTGLVGTAANGRGSIYIENGASATISNVEINGSKGVHACIWHQGKSVNIESINCYGADDGVFSWADVAYSQTTGDNFTIKNSYFHDFTNKTSNGHIDGYQTEGANNGMIDHNTFYMTSDDSNYTDSAIAIWNSLRSSNNITVQNNLFAGGGATIYAEDYSPSESNNLGGFSTSNIIFKYNRFSTIFNPCVGFGPGWDGMTWFRVGPTDGWKRTGNTVIETGENIDNGNPHLSNGSVCG